jgi:poly-beta-hydroxybutyrate-responsive repressor
MKTTARIPLPVIQTEDCACDGRTLARLVQPAILAALAQSEAHGYMIVHRLSEMPMYCGHTPDTTGVYRFLRQMERKGLVSSEWEASAAGPAKRLYRITDEGRGCLRRWVKTLTEYRNAIESLLEFTRDAG